MFDLFTLCVSNIHILTNVSNEVLLVASAKTRINKAHDPQNSIFQMHNIIIAQSPHPLSPTPTPSPLPPSPPSSPPPPSFPLPLSPPPPLSSFLPTSHSVTSYWTHPFYFVIQYAVRYLSDDILYHWWMQQNNLFPTKVHTIIIKEGWLTI